MPDGEVIDLTLPVPAPEAEPQTTVSDGRHILAHRARERKNLKEAMQHLAAMHRDRPDDIIVLKDLGAVLGEMENGAASRIATEKALRIDPNDGQLWANLGIACLHMGDLDRAGEAFAEAQRLGLDDAWLYRNLAMLAYRQGYPIVALAHMEKAIERDPECQAAYGDRGLITLATGNWVAGFAANEARWHMIKAGPGWFTGARHWQREPLEGRSILVHHEQGQGDTLQFCRWAKAMTVDGIRVVFAVPASLVRLMRQSGVGHQVLDIDGPLPLTDYHSPLMAHAMYMAAGFGAEWTGPYLSAASEPPRTRDTDRLKVGLVWAGSPVYGADRRRSMALADFMPLFNLPGIDFYSLQKGPREDDITALGVDAWLTPLGPLFRDFADTASAIAELDLVVSVDTAPAHLAAAMGKPVFLLLQEGPCWRWPREGEKTEWYPTVRLFRQKAVGKWAPVVEEVAGMLACFKR